MRSTHTDNALVRLAVCVAAVIATTAVLTVLPVSDRPLTAALSFLFVVLLVSAAWGLRYALFVSALAGLGFAWLVPPRPYFWIDQGRSVFALAAFLVTGSVGSYLSDRARREAFNAMQRHAEAVDAQRQFADLVNSVEGIVWEADAQTFQFLFVSEQAERILGYPTERWLNEPTFWKDHLHPDDRDSAVALCLTATAAKKNHDFEYRMIAADGRSVWLRDIVTVVAEGDRAAKLRGVMVDTTRRRRSEEELRRNEAYLAEAQRLTHMGSWAWSPGARRATYWSEEMFRIWGFDPKEDPPDAETAWQRIHPEDRDRYHQQLEAARGGSLKDEVALDHRIVLPDGTVKHVHGAGHPVLDETGEVVEYVGTTIDVTDRKRAEEELRESGERYRYIFEAAGVSVWEEDFSQVKAAIDDLKAQGVQNFGEYLAAHPDFVRQAISQVKVLDVNDATTKLFGARSKEELRVSLDKIFLPETEEVFAGELLAIAEGRTSFEAETVLQSLQGNRLAVLLTITFPPPPAQLDRVLVSITDITERKRAEGLLAGEKQILEMVARGASLGQILDSLCRLVEEQAHDVLTSILLLEGDRLRHGGAPSLPKEYTEAIDGLVIGPNVGSCGTAAYRAEQVIVSDIARDPLWADYREAALPHSLRACWSTPIFSSDGNVIATFAMYYREPRSPSAREQGIIEQITHLAGVAIQRKLGEEKLRESEQRFRNLADTAPVMIWVSGTDKLCTYFNQQWLFFTGRSLQEELGNGWREGVHPDDYEPCLQTYIAAFGRRQPFSMEYRLRRSDGEFRLVTDTGVPRFSPGREFLGYIGTCLDITERQRAEEALQKTQAELAHVTRVTTMGELTSSIAHEINQPLAAIVTNGSACLRWLAGEPPDLDEARQTVQRIIKEGDRASEVIRRIRALVKKAPPQKDRLDMNEIIREVTELARGEAQRKGVALKTQLSNDLPPALGDRVQLEQVILNLMMNGIEAMSGVKEGPRELLVRSERDESNGLLVAVQDTGIGLDSANLERLFEPFFTTKPSGMGMGLAISRSIVTAHGGRLWATPNMPQGAVLQFTLPQESERAS